MQKKSLIPWSMINTLMLTLITAGTIGLIKMTLDCDKKLAVFAQQFDELKQRTAEIPDLRQRIVNVEIDVARIKPRLTQ